MAQKHCLDQYRKELIERITMVSPVLDDLKQMGLLTDEQYECVRCKDTTQEQMRELFTHIKYFNHDAKTKVFKSFKEANPAVITCLVKRRRNPGYKFGNILNVECTGASKITTKDNNLTHEGLRASYAMAQTDSVKMQQYKDIIDKAAKRRNIDPAMVAGIMSRSSRGGDLLIDGRIPGGDSFGLMQVCELFYPPAGEWNSQGHVDQAVEILVGMINTIKVKFPDWTPEQQLKGGIAAYNCGPLHVHNYDEIDKFTNSQDYSNDVVARAHWFSKYWYNAEES